MLILGFNSNSENWQEVIDMAPGTAELSDFGVNMLFTEEHLIVSWPRTYVQGGPPDDCGEVIAYQKSGDGYEEVNRINASDLVGDCVAGDGFGYGLAYDGGRMAIGMPAGARAGSNLPGGATDSDSRVFITTFSDGNWQLEETLVADDLGNGKGMGFQLVLEDDLLLVHAHEYDSIFGVAFPVSTGVYIFEDEGSGFAQKQKLTENHHLFGQDFDYENDQIIIGAWGEQTIGAPGKIYVYEEQSDNWNLVQTINDSRNKNLGNQIEILGDTMIAGSVNAGGVGAVVVFKRSGGNWQETQFIEASDNAINDQFGIAVRLDEDDLIVGASAGTNQVQTVGAAYHFIRGVDGVYVEQQKIESPKQNEAADQFGANLIFNNTDLLINEPSGRNLQGGVTNFWHFSRTGASEPSVMINQRSSGTWQAIGIEGQSFNLEVINDNQALMYLNYATDSGSSWLFSVGRISNNSINFNNVLMSSGTQFGENFDSQELTLTSVGSASFAINSCESGTLNLELNNQESQQFELEKTFAISSLDCNSVNKILENGVSGSWFDPMRSGEGFSIYTHGIDDDQMASIHWYTYDNSGNPIVFYGQGTVQGSMISIRELKQYGAGNAFESTTEPTTMGSLNLLWEGCADLMVDYDLSSSGLGIGTYNLTQLVRVKGSNCQ